MDVDSRESRWVRHLKLPILCTVANEMRDHAVRVHRTPAIARHSTHSSRLRVLGVVELDRDFRLLRRVRRVDHRDRQRVQIFTLD